MKPGLGIFLVLAVLTLVGFSGTGQTDSPSTTGSISPAVTNGTGVTGTTAATGSTTGSQGTTASTGSTGTTAVNVHSPAFDNNYYNGTGNGHLFICDNSTTAPPAMYAITFNGGVMNNAVDATLGVDDVQLFRLAADRVHGTLQLADRAADAGVCNEICHDVCLPCGRPNAATLRKLSQRI